MNINVYWFLVIQLERKRHLGNDICNIVFQEDEYVFIFILMSVELN